MTVEEKAEDLLIKFGSKETAALAVDEIITAEIQFVFFVNRSYMGDREIEYDTGYWHDVKKKLNA